MKPSDIQPATPITSNPTQPQNDSLQNIKISPGAMSASATNGAIKAHVTPTSRLLSGGGMAMRVSISQQRVKVQ